MVSWLVRGNMYPVELFEALRKLARTPQIFFLEKWLLGIFSTQSLILIKKKKKKIRLPSELAP